MNRYSGFKGDVVLLSKLPVFMLALYAVTGSVFSQETAVSGKELADFLVTIYTGAERLPLDGLVTPEGLPYNSAVLDGKYILINMGASWCPYCREEKPSLQRLYTGHADEKFGILSIFLNEQADAVKSYIEENQYMFPVAVDAANRLREAYAPRIPASYLLGPGGNIIARINGWKEWDGETALRVLAYLMGGGR